MPYAKQVLVGVLAVAASCEKTAPQVIDRDALWALAPDNMVAGAVVMPGALAKLERAFFAVRKILPLAPDLAPFEEQIGALERKEKIKLSLEGFGMTSRKPAAVFFVEGFELIVVLPIVDRAGFVKLAEGTRSGDLDSFDGLTCTQVKSVYACATQPALLGRIGKGTVPAALAAVGVRGEIELAITDGKNPPIAGVVELAPGGLTLRAVATEVPASLRNLFANVAPRIDPARTPGFGLVSFAALRAAWGTLPSTPLVPQVTLDAFVKSIDGPLTTTIATGSSTIDAHLPLADAAPASRLVGQCDKLPPLAAIGVAVTDGVCHVKNAQLNLETDAWVEDGVLRLGERGDVATGVVSAPSPTARELASGAWTIAIVGRGTVLAPTTLRIPPEVFLAEDPIGSRMMTLFNEVAIGLRLDGDVVRILATVRTIWANPDDVLAKLIAIDPKDVFAGQAAARSEAIATGSPGSPFAGDYRAGNLSLLAPLWLMAAVEELLRPVTERYIDRLADPTGKQ